MDVTGSRLATVSRPEPVGAKFLSNAADSWDGLRPFEGASYCQAVATAGERGFLVRPDSIGVCRWSPVVLGLKEVEGGFETRLQPRREGAWGVALATLPGFAEAGVEPDVVILRDTAANLRFRLAKLGRANCAMQYAGRMDKSALAILEGGTGGWKARLIGVVNPTLAWLNRVPGWKKTTEIVFRSKKVSDLYDRLIAACMADMSICRNSTVIPSLTGKANLSHFCTGGVAWGENRPEHMTCGIPYALYAEVNE